MDADAETTSKGKRKAEEDADVMGGDEEPSTSAVKGKAKAVTAPAGGTAKKTLDAALKWVQDVLDLKDTFDRILKSCFRDDKGIQTAMNEVSFA